MAKPGFDQFGFDYRLKGFQLMIGVIVEVENGSCTYRNLDLILEVLFNPFIRHQLVL